jgi:hypothetical protein
MEMDVKPRSMSMKDYLVRVLAVKMMMAEKTIETVINHQFQSSSEAMLNNGSVEISGFGKFYFNKKKAQNKLEALVCIKGKLEDELKKDTLSDKQRGKHETRLQGVCSEIDYLIKKTNTND